jgi:hypothetical protein
VAALTRRPGLAPQEESTRNGERACSAYTWPSAVFPPSLKGFAIYGGEALWRQGQASLRSVLRSLDTRLPTVAPQRKEGAKTTLQRASRSDGRATP